MTDSTFLRTRRDGCWSIQTNQYGSFLAPTDDPDADTVITKEQFEGFELRDDYPVIPNALWERWIQLCIELVRRGTGNLEVSCRLLRNDAGDYRIVVPQQEVTVVSVRVNSFDSCVDIETGEVITQFPPDGWSACGSSHSHNTMDSFFSGTDDQFELGDPGMHIVVGNIDVDKATYTLKASITANKRRFYIDPVDAVELCSEDDSEPATYHPAVLDAIKLPAQRTQVKTIYPKIGTVRTLEDEWYSYSSPSSSNYADVAPEMEKVMDAVAAVELACKQHGLNPLHVLNRLAFEIEDVAACHDDLMADPFYFSTSY